jgi:hypothetical protein
VISHIVEPNDLAARAAGAGAPRRPRPCSIPHKQMGASATVRRDGETWLRPQGLILSAFYHWPRCVARISNPTGFEKDVAGWNGESSDKRMTVSRDNVANASDTSCGSLYPPLSTPAGNLPPPGSGPLRLRGGHRTEAVHQQQRPPITASGFLKGDVQNPYRQI